MTNNEKDKLLVIKNTFLQEIPSSDCTLTRGTSAPVSMPKKDLGGKDNMSSVEEYSEEDRDMDSLCKPVKLETHMQGEISRLRTGDLFPCGDRELSMFPSEISRLQTGDVLPPISPEGANSHFGSPGLQTWQPTDFDFPGRKCTPNRTDVVSEEVTCHENSCQTACEATDELSPPSPPDLSRLVTGDYFDDNWIYSQQREQVSSMMQRLQQENAAIDPVLGQVLPAIQIPSPMMIPCGVMVQGAPMVAAPSLPGTQWPPCYVENVSQDPPMPVGLERTIVAQSGAHRITWSVDARKLKSTDRQIVSPLFYMLGLSCPFKLLLFPVVSSESRGGASFKNAGGKGFVQLKCEGAPSGGSKGWIPLMIRFFVGSNEEPRGPVSNDFHEQPVCGLPQSVAHWDLAASAENGRIYLGVEALRQNERV